MPQETPRIIIVGAGFGGLYVASGLLPLVRKGLADVTIINRTNYFLFTPLLHEVATGGLTPTSVTEPLREIFAGTGVRVCQGEISEIDASAKTIRIGECVLPYDYAVIATGSETAEYGIPGALSHGLPLKTLGDAIRIRERVIDAFEKAALARDPAARKRLLSFVVVGGGATGVEVAAELEDFADGMLRRFQAGREGIRREDVSIGLVSAGPEILPLFHPSLRKAAARRLRQKGIALRLGASVGSVESERLTFADGTSMPFGTLIWAAGVKPQLPPFAGSAPAMRQGRLRVEPTLRVEGQERLFALGDAAAFIGKDGKPIPMFAQIAVAQAKTVAANLAAAFEGRPLREFRFRSKGHLVSLGQWFAVGEIFSARLRGRFAWWLWRTIYLFKFLSWKKRIRIAFEWTINLFYPRDITKLT